MLIPLSNDANLVQNDQFTMEAIFVTIAMVKVEIIPDFYTLAFVLIN